MSWIIYFDAKSKYNFDKDREWTLLWSNCPLLDLGHSLDVILAWPLSNR